MGYIDVRATLEIGGKPLVKNDKAKIKVRGNSTSEALKKPYTIKFSKKLDIFGFGADKK